MNSKSENAVQNTNTVSTSEERSQAHSPVVISRRRLLRAGVSGIPILLTMNGIAPAESIVIGASAASAINYDGHGIFKTFRTFSDDPNLVWSDENGFILKSKGGDRYIETEDVDLVSDDDTVTVTLTLTTTDDDLPSTIQTSLNKSVSCHGVDSIGKFNYFLRKCNQAEVPQYNIDNWYTDLDFHSNDISSTSLEDYLINHLSSIVTGNGGVSIDYNSVSSTDPETGLSQNGVSITPNTQDLTEVTGSDGTYYFAKKAGLSDGFIRHDVVITFPKDSIIFTDTYLDDENQSKTLTYKNSNTVSLSFKVMSSKTTYGGTATGTDSSGD